MDENIILKKNSINLKNDVTFFLLVFYLLKNIKECLDDCLPYRNNPFEVTQKACFIQRKRYRVFCYEDRLQIWLG